MNADNSPLLSIIIPTKNRYETLVPVINTLLKNINSNDFEIIIQDNSDSNLTVLNYFETLQDQRLRYFYQPESLSISDNTTQAIEKIRGKYAIFIGDDDLVSPHICEIVKKLDSVNGVGLIYTPANYWWESVDFQNENFYYQKKALWIPKNISTKFVLKKAGEELDFVLKKGAIGYYHLPRFYHGIVLTSALEKIRKQIGTYLSGSCPDIALATSLSFVVENYYFVNYPVSVFGACRNSGGGWTMSKSHHGKIAEQKFLQNGIEERWDPNIPLIWSERTIYPQTVFETLKAFKSDRQINYPAFYASMLANERFLFKYWWPAVKSYCKKNSADYLKIMAKYLRISTGVHVDRLKKRTRSFGYQVVPNQSIDDCMKTLQKLQFSKKA